MTPTDFRLAPPRHLVGAAAIVIALLTLIVLPAATRAEDILRLGGPVTDTTGVLADGEDAIVAAIGGTRDSHGVEVFVLFIRTTGDRTAADYASETAARNSLGGDDALLLVALDDRTDQIWVADGLDEITDDELDEIITGILEPGLRDGEFAAAVVGSVEALGLAASSAPITAPPATTPPGGGGSTGGDGGIGLGAIVGVVLIAGGAFFLWRRRGRDANAATRGVETAPSSPAPDAAVLAREANALLIATDERIRDAGQETDFAEAQFGPEAVTTFRTAVADARDELAKAFAIRQRLDDATPEDEPTRIALLQEIIDWTSKAQDRLDAETERIRELRDLERDAPNTLVELPARIEAVEDRLDATSQTMAGLRAYAEAVWRPVEGNLEEARKGLAGARTAVTIGSAAAASDDASDVALATRTALEGMTGAGLLLDEIDQLAASVADAGRRIPGELAAAERDLGDATSTVAGRPVDTGTDTRRRAAATALQVALGAASAGSADPIETLRLATEARRLAGEALQFAQDTAAAADRVMATADSTIRTASAEIDRAASFIASRRRGVGEVARTRLAEADRHLAEAKSLLSSDPKQALEGGRQAQALAQEAYRLAQGDFTDWDQGGPGWGQRAGTPEGDQTAAVLGQILGGIVGGVLAGGGRSGGGWGGSPWGGSGSGGGGGLGDGWGGGGGFGSGGFGGGGGGGGGGRSRGGRW